MDFFLGFPSDDPARHQSHSREGLAFSIFSLVLLAYTATVNWSYIIIGGAGLQIALLTLVYTLTARRSDGAIKALEAHNKWLKEQLDQANNNAPDVLVERQKKRIEQYKEELEQLSNDYEANKALIEVKVAELERAEELLGELEYYKDQFACPTCGAELTTLAGEEEEVRAYACGSTSSPNGEYPCPYDPEFPRLEDYNREVRQLASGKFFCNPKAKNKNAYKLTLQPQGGETEEEAKQKIANNYQRLLPKNLRG
ncbi:MAG TPA: hypothetical protein VFX97_01360 [Pyrinomonadaceae bacterium]|nr:hypothetical protein [Pyrinomonadaceae bacterium]